jgi:GNAT superfamily N-acetyltransferase
MPGEEPCSLETFDEWNAQWTTHPGHHLEAALLALLDGELVGWSMIEIPPLMKGAAWHMSTGVLRNYRGRGIAQTIKYETLLNARRLGVTSIHTGNHTENAAMLHINNKLGYQRKFAQVMLLKEVAL